MFDGKLLCQVFESRLVLSREVCWLPPTSLWPGAAGAGAILYISFTSAAGPVTGLVIASTSPDPAQHPDGNSNLMCVHFGRDAPILTSMHEY